MAKPTVRIAAIQVGFALGIGAVLARTAQLQILDGKRWAAEARRLRTEHVVLPARRGALFDRNGVPLAVTQEFFHVGVAPNELTDPQGLPRALAAALGLSAAAVTRELRSGKRWLYYHGPYTATQVEALRAIRGVHLEGEFQRFYPSRDLARPIIGGLGGDGAAGTAGAGTAGAGTAGAGTAGLELSLDWFLTGRPGEAVLLKDRAGQRYDSPARLVRQPVAGHDVVLTLDAALQEIAERGLDEALGAMRAEGGDVVFLDPETGELLAMASREVRPSGEVAARASSFTVPFEPGSTAKLFTAAALLERRRVAPADAVFAEGGRWEMPVTTTGRTRTITDSHKERGNLTLAEAIRVSSNVAMAKFSLRLSPVEQFETLRDFGFGSPTGAEFPSEARGRLARPDTWQPMYTRASLAMGYEFTVTPVQLAAAYGAIANHGVLLTPTLVREVRDAAGTVVYRHQPEPVRRVVPPEIAARLRDFLRGAVGEGGTGEEAQLVNYSLMGKTGTAVRFENGRYVRGEYTASFAALFPADHPQLVVIVKIDNPRGDYYGGLTAAPVTRTMLQQALASRRIAIDRGRLAPRAPAPRDPVLPANPPRDPGPAADQPRVVVAWPRPATDSASAPRAVPDVVGWTARDAALALHRLGFRVVLRGFGRVARTAPAARIAAPPGSPVTLWANP